MKYASVCSGVEAASLAWMPLGWEAAWFSEIEPFPCAVLKERFPNVPNLGDMTKIKVENLENGDQKFTSGDGPVVLVPGGVDLLVGGTPCQSFSVAGKREGLDGASGLARTFVQLLESMQPRWFVWENVPGCLSSRNKQTGIYDFNFLLAAFAEVGYTCGWRILDAQYVRVDGYPRAIPQRRRRVFVIGHLGAEWQYPAEVLFEPHSLSWNTPPRRVKGQGTAADAQRCLGTASTLRMRAGCEGGGKGALISNERSLTLAAAGNDQAVFTDRHWDNSGVNPTLSQCGAANGIPGSSNQELFAQNFNGLVADVDAATFWNGNQYAESLICTSDRQLMPDKARLQCVVETKDVSGVNPTLNQCNSGNGQENVICENMGQYGFDGYNQIATGDVCKSLTSAATDRDHNPIVYSIVLNDQGGSVMQVENDGNAGTLRANTHGNEQIVCFQQNTRDEVRLMNGDGHIAGALAAESGMKQTNYICYDNHPNGNEQIVCVHGAETPIFNMAWYANPITANHGGLENVISCNSKQNGLSIGEEFSSTLRRDMGDNQTAVAIAENIIGRQVQNGGNGTGAQEELAYTQNASGVMGVANSATVRRLLPIECERLMGFPDNWTRIPWKGKPAEDCPDSPRYKACGNSFCVNVVRWIGLRIEMVERRMNRDKN